MDENLLNPFNTTLNSSQINTDWEAYSNLLADVQAFHENLMGKYHPQTYSFYGKSKGGNYPQRIGLRRRRSGAGRWQAAK